MFCDEDSDDDECDMMNDMSENPHLNSDQKGMSVGNETIPDIDFNHKQRKNVQKNM